MMRAPTAGPGEVAAARRSARLAPGARVASVLLFGGSFDPVHHGHLLIARHVAEQLHADQVVLIPGARPPHKQDVRLAPAPHRLAMCRLAVAGDPQFEVSDWELGQPGPSYTLHTVRHFRAQQGPAGDMYWLIGMDSLNELGTWYRAAELVDACTIVTAARPGFAEPDDALLRQHFSPDQSARLRRHIVTRLHIDIASTDIRTRVRAGRSIRYQVPEAVRDYIDRCGLYRGTEPEVPHAPQPARDLPPS